MRRLRAWTWKEAREHRWALLGVLATVALITVLPFVAFKAETTRAHLDRLPGLAVALATLVLGLDLFARETRRSTHALILRTPGAMRWAFPAKLLVFGLGTLAALAVEEVLRQSLEALTGVPRPYQLLRIEGEWTVIARTIPLEIEFGLPIATYAALLAAAVGTWHVAGSVVSPRAGIGALCGVLVLGVLAVPLMLLNAHHPWWFRPSAGETYLWLAAIGLIGLLAAGVAWYSGRKFLFPRRRAAVRAGLTVLVSAALVTGGTAYAIDRWEAADSRAPEFRIEFGFLGAGGGRLYLTTSRGSLHGDSTHSGRQSPPIAWTVELDDPTGRASHARKSSFFALPPGIAHTPALVPIPFVVRIDQDLPRSDTDSDRWTWIDATSDVERVVGGARTFTAATIEAARATAKAQTPLRDSKGRRVWWVEGVVERDGDEDRVPPPGPDARRWVGSARLSRSGFVMAGRFPDPERHQRHGLHEQRVVDAETGEWTGRSIVYPPTPPGFDTEPNDGGSFALGESKFVVRKRFVKPTGEVEADSGWLIWDAAKPDRFEPAPGGPRGLFMLSVEEGTILVPMDTGPEQAVGERARSKLVLWNPLTGGHVPVESADASLLSPGRLYSMGILPDGRRLIGLYELTQHPFALQGRHALALFDLAKRTLTPIAPWSEHWWNPIAFDVDGSLLVIDGGRRVVRLSDEGRKRAVVWPR